MDNLDRIEIKDLALRCVIGIFDWEREIEQDVLLNISLFADLGGACNSDRFEETIDYKALTKSIVGMVEKSKCFLIEALAEKTADICLEHPKVRKVEVSVEKPGALRHARSVGIRITRARRED